MTLRSVVLAGLVLLLVTGAALAANIDGKWTGEFQMPNGNTRPVTFTFTSDGNTLNGSTSGRNGEVKISNGKIDGDNVSFDVVREFQGNSVTQHYTGTVSGSELKLKMQMGDREPREMVLKKQ